MILLIVRENGFWNLGKPKPSYFNSVYNKRMLVVVCAVIKTAILFLCRQILDMYADWWGSSSSHGSFKVQCDFEQEMWKHTQASTEEHYTGVIFPSLAKF